MTWYSWFWLAWSTVLLIGFGVVEILAMRSKDDLSTLSENMQWLLTKRAWIRWLSLFAWGAFAVWFGAHLWGSSL